MITSFFKNYFKWSLILVVGIYSQCKMDAQNKQNTGITVETAEVIEAAPVYTASNPGWHVKLDDAFAESQKTGKPIMANFTGSDWCGWCKKLTASVFSQPDFKSWAEKNVVLLELDFPRRFQVPEDIQQQNFSLQNSFQVRGYPTVWVFNLNRDETTNQYSIEALGKTGYAPTVGQFTSEVENMFKQD